MSGDYDQDLATLKSMVALGDKVFIDVGLLLLVLQRRSQRELDEAANELRLSKDDVKFLLKIAALVSPAITARRLAEIGLSRLAIVLPVMTGDNSVALIELAEQYPLDQLQEMVEATSPVEQLPKLRAKRRELGQIDKTRRSADRIEAKLRGLLGSAPKSGSPFARMGRSAAARIVIPFDQEKPASAALLPLRIEGDAPWTVYHRSVIAGHIEGLLLAAIPTLNEKLNEYPEDIAQVRQIAVYLRGPDVPGDGFTARQMGFQRGENPYPPGSEMQREWDRCFDKPDWTDLGLRMFRN